MALHILNIYMSLFMVIYANSLLKAVHQLGLILTQSGPHPIRASPSPQQGLILTLAGPHLTLAGPYSYPSRALLLP